MYMNTLLCYRCLIFLSFLRYITCDSYLYTFNGPSILIPSKVKPENIIVEHRFSANKEMHLKARNEEEITFISGYHRNFDTKDLSLNQDILQKAIKFRIAFRSLQYNCRDDPVGPLTSILLLHSFSNLLASASINALVSAVQMLSMSETSRLSALIDLTFIDSVSRNIVEAVSTDIVRGNYNLRISYSYTFYYVGDSPWCARNMNTDMPCGTTLGALPIECIIKIIYIRECVPSFVGTTFRACDEHYEVYAEDGNLQWITNYDVPQSTKIMIYNDVVFVKIMVTPSLDVLVDILISSQKLLNHGGTPYVSFAKLGGDIHSCSYVIGDVYWLGEGRQVIRTGQTTDMTIDQTIQWLHQDILPIASRYIPSGITPLPSVGDATMNRYSFVFNSYEAVLYYTPVKLEHQFSISNGMLFSAYPSLPLYAFYCAGGYLTTYPIQTLTSCVSKYACKYVPLFSDDVVEIAKLSFNSNSGIEVTPIALVTIYSVSSTNCSCTTCPTSYVNQTYFRIKYVDGFMCDMSIDFNTVNTHIVQLNTTYLDLFNDYIATSKSFSKALEEAGIVSSDLIRNYTIMYNNFQESKKKNDFMFDVVNTLTGGLPLGLGGMNILKDFLTTLLGLGGTTSFWDTFMKLLIGSGTALLLLLIGFCVFKAYQAYKLREHHKTLRHMQRNGNPIDDDEDRNDNPNVIIHHEEDKDHQHPAVNKDLKDNITIKDIKKDDKKVSFEKKDEEEEDLKSEIELTEKLGRKHKFKSEVSSHIFNQNTNSTLTINERAIKANSLLELRDRLLMEVSRQSDKSASGRLALADRVSQSIDTYTKVSREYLKSTLNTIHDIEVAIMYIFSNIEPNEPVHCEFITRDRLVTITDIDGDIFGHSSDGRPGVLEDTKWNVCKRFNTDSYRHFEANFRTAWIDCMITSMGAGWTEVVIKLMKLVQDKVACAPRGRISFIKSQSIRLALRDNDMKTKPKAMESVFFDYKILDLKDIYWILVKYMLTFMRVGIDHETMEPIQIVKLRSASTADNITSAVLSKSREIRERELEAARKALAGRSASISLPPKPDGYDDNFTWNPLHEVALLDELDDDKKLTNIEE